MAQRPFLRAAARNNAEWCDAFCRTHGIAGRFGAECWTSPERTPPFYPDAVSLSPGVAPADVLAQIDAAEGCSVKDSFADLDLAAHGFRTLFRAEWLLLEPGDARGAPPGRAIVVETPERLVEWESAWGGSPTGLPFFRPALLANPAIALLARDDGDGIAAGAIANRSATVIGISNVFDARGELGSAWLDAAGAARARWGPLPVVGYASGTALEAAHEAGLAGIGELAVWMHDAGA